MNEAQIDVLTLLPQRPPFVMIDRLMHCDPKTTVTELEVRGDNLFVEEGHLSATGMVENIAQTCAARMGYINLCANKPVKLGVIGAIRNFELTVLPPVGATLTTTIEVQEEVFQMLLVEATVACNGAVQATAQMKIALTDTDAANEQR